MAATALLPPARWPWLLGVAVALFTVALVALLLRLFGRATDERTAAVAGVTAAFGLAALACADPSLDGLPLAPALSPLLGWPPALSLAIGAAGLLRMITSPVEIAGRRLLGAGGLLLVLAALFPQVTAGVLSLPLFAAWGSGALDGLLTLAIAVSGGAFLALALREKMPSVKALRVGAVIALALLPGWQLLHVIDGGLPCAVRAIWTAAGSVAVTISIGHVLQGDPRKLAASFEWLAVLLLSTLYWLLKQQGLGYAATDEGIYFYAAKLWADGSWPYRDFFFSHPPVQLIAPALLYKLAGFTYVGSKLVAPLAGFGAGLVLWRSIRKHFGPIAGVSTLGLFWLAAEVLKSTTTFTGAETATLFLALGVAAALDRRSVLAGVWFGLASATAIYASSGLLSFALLFLLVPRGEATSPWWKRHDAVRIATAFLVTFGAINLVFYAIGGGRYVDGVYRYHLLKAAKDPNQQSFLDGPGAIIHNIFVLLDSHELRVFLAYHAAVVWLALLAPILLLARRWGGLQTEPLWPPSRWWRSSEGRVVALVLATLGSLVTLAQLSERYDYYFMIVFPTLVPLAGFAVAELVRWLDAVLPRPQPSRKKPAVAAVLQWPWAAVALIAAALWLPVNGWANAAAFPEELTARGSSRGAGEVLSFEWTPAPVIPALGEVVHALWWSDTRTRGDLESSIQSYLRAKKRTFSTAPQIADYIREHTGPDDTITGGSDYAPLLALLAGRRLAGNQIDTNSKVFRTGIVSEHEFWSRVCQDRPAYLVSAEMSYFAPENLSNLPTVVNDFRPEQEFDETRLKYRRVVPIRLLRRRQEPPQTICSTY